MVGFFFKYSRLCKRDCYFARFAQKEMKFPRLRDSSQNSGIAMILASVEFRYSRTTRWSRRCRDYSHDHFWDLRNSHLLRLRNPSTMKFKTSDVSILVILRYLGTHGLSILKFLISKIAREIGGDVELLKQNLSRFNNWLNRFYFLNERKSLPLGLDNKSKTNLEEVWRKYKRKYRQKYGEKAVLLAEVDCRPTRRLICIAWQGCFPRRRPFTCCKAGMRCMSLFLDFRPSVGWLIFIFPLGPFIQAEFTLFSSSIPQVLLLDFLPSSLFPFFFLSLLHFND